MRRRQKKDTLEIFNLRAKEAGLTYAEEQRRETIHSMGRIRAPRGEDGEPVYIKVSARSAMKNAGKAAGGRK